MLAAAAAVIAAKGFHDAQMTEIASAAEVSLATLYALFDGKDRIFEEVLTAAATAMREEVRAKVMPIADARERLLALIDALFACFDANRDLLRDLRHGHAGSALAHAAADGRRGSATSTTTSSTGSPGSRATRAAAGLLAGIEPDVFAVSLVGAVTATASRWVELRAAARSQRGRRFGARDLCLRARRGVAMKWRFALGVLAALGCHSGAETVTPPAAAEPLRARHRGGGARARDSEPIPATGSVLAEKTTEIGPRVDGLVEEVAVRVGDRVAEGAADLPDPRRRLPTAARRGRGRAAPGDGRGREGRARPRARAHPAREGRGIARAPRPGRDRARDHARARRDRARRRGDRPSGRRGLRGSCARTRASSRVATSTRAPCCAR